MRNDLLVAYYNQHRGGGGPAANEIWYWADEQITLYNSSGVASHTFADGKGVVTYSSDLTTMPNTFRGTDATSITMPDSITRIPGYTVYGLDHLVALTLSSALTTVDGSACRNNAALASLTIPASVETIGGSAFAVNSSLASVTFLGTPSSVASNAFATCNALYDIYVPWASGAVANAPWGATKATIHYNSTT